MLQNNKRSESEIVFDILVSAKKDIKRTTLMHRSNLSYVQLIRYLKPLIDKDLIEENIGHNNEKLYHITYKGEEYLKPLSSVVKLLNKQEILKLAIPTGASSRVFRQFPRRISLERFIRCKQRGIRPS